MTTITRPCYCVREEVKRALDVKVTARADGQVDRAIEAASNAIDGGTARIGGRMGRRFYAERRTMTFDWPGEQYARPWRLWLNQHELVSVTELVAGGITIAPGDYILRPDDGPPFTHVEIDLSSTAAFGGGSTPQRGIVITGVYGYADDRAPAGALAEALDATETGVDITNSALVGVGDVVLVDDERMLVTGRSMLDTGQLLGADLAANAAATSVTVTTGSAYATDEVVLIDGERMLVVDVAGNTLVVRRGWDGSALAAHTTGARIYASRTLTVTRGALGSTAATHALSAQISRAVVPALVRDLCVAFAINQFEQETSGYARVAGSGDNAREVSGRSLRHIDDQAVTAYGRRARKRAV